jgi:hypothetical protein
MHAAAQAVRLGSYHFLPFLPDSIVHASTMFVELASTPGLGDPSNYCPLEDWSLDAYETTLADQILYGFVLLHTARALDPDATLQQRAVRIPARYLDSVVPAELADRLARTISATREEDRREFSAPGQTAAHIGWDHTPFELQPFLRGENGSLLLLSPRASQAWMTRGIYFRMMEAARGREDAGDTEDDRVERFTRFCGPLAERYVLNLAKRSYEVHALDPPARVSGEQPYLLNKSRAWSPDVAISQPPDLVLIEVYSGRIRREARVDPTPHEVHETHTKLLIGKLEKLQKRIAELFEGLFTPKGVCDVEAVKVWPVLLLAGEGIALTPSRPRVSDRAIPTENSAQPAWFGQPARLSTRVSGAIHLLASRHLRKHVSAWCCSLHVLSPLLHCLRHESCPCIYKRWRARYWIPSRVAIGSRRESKNATSGRWVFGSESGIATRAGGRPVEW